MTEILECFEKCRADAMRTFDPQFVSREIVIANAKSAGLSEDNLDFLDGYFDYADEELLRFIWHYYYLLFETNADFSRDIWQLDEIEVPKEAEEKFLGGTKAVIFLLATENLKKWAQGKDIDEAALIESYYDRYRYMVSLNFMSHETYGLVRLSPFLYGYTKPFILRVGRLNFQILGFRDYGELYEDKDGHRIFAALPNYTYGEDGFQAKEGFVPFYSKDDKFVTAHVFEFENQGRISLEARKIDLSVYERKLAPGDRIITVHIPEGGKLETDAVIKSIKDAQVFFRKYFSPIKAVVCQTWFIFPGLRGEVIKDGSNMAAFADLFDVISGTDNENHSIFEHVFKVKRQPLEDLVPKNDFQRRVVERALRGEKIYWGFGVLKHEYEA